MPVRAWFKWLTRHNYFLYNPASEMELPRARTTTCRSIVLTASQAEAILMVPDVDTPLGVRDRGDPGSVLLDRHPSDGNGEPGSLQRQLRSRHADGSSRQRQERSSGSDRWPSIEMASKNISTRFVRYCSVLIPKEPAMFISGRRRCAISSSHIAQIVSSCIEQSPAKGSAAVATCSGTRWPR